MSDTPETDHLENELGSAAKFSHPVIWRHARQLERERDEARNTVEQLTKHGLDLMDANRTLKSKLKRLKENTK